MGFLGKNSYLWVEESLKQAKGTTIPFQRFGSIAANHNQIPNTMIYYPKKNLWFANRKEAKMVLGIKHYTKLLKDKEFRFFPNNLNALNDEQTISNNK